MIIVNGFQPLTIITKHSILDVAVALDAPLYTPTIEHGRVLLSGDDKNVTISYNFIYLLEDLDKCKVFRLISDLKRATKKQKACFLLTM